MKYFISVYSFAREERRVFEMNSVTAEHYYTEYLCKFSHAHIQRCLQSGARTVCPHNDVQIWGENISDSEVFKRRLIGSVNKESFEL